jgi:hypothetical protein
VNPGPQRGQFLLPADDLGKALHLGGHHPLGAPTIGLIRWRAGNPRLWCQLACSRDGRGRRRVRRVPVQSRRLSEDVTLQLSQRRPRVNAQLLSQLGPGIPQHCQRLGLAPGPIQRHREQLTAVFTQRMGPHVQVQLGHYGVVPAQLQLRRAPGLDHRQPQLVQPRHLRCRPLGIPHVGVGLPAP